MPTSVVVIPDDDVQQSEGISEVCGQPIAAVQVVSSAPVKFSPSKDPNESSQTLVYPGEDVGEGSSTPSIFVPTWNLHNESRLFVRANAVECALHAFPPAAVADMEAMGSPALSHNMSYVAVQEMFYLVAGARHIQSLEEMEVVHAGCGSCVSELERRVFELGDDLQRSEQKY